MGSEWRSESRIEPSDTEYTSVTPEYQVKNVYCWEHGAPASLGDREEGKEHPL